MPDYQQGKIYKLYSISNEKLVYYGSTTETLRTRLSKHVYNNNNNNNNTQSKLVLNEGDYKIELIENYPCANKQQLNKREGEYIKNNVCVNKLIAGRTLQEYYQDNKEYITKIHKDYRENNKKFILQIGKDYREKNKEKLNEQNKHYRKKNKEKLNEKETCECGCLVIKNNIKRHQQTPKHIKLMEEKNNLGNN
tara:strand:+ start:60 stop:641 length:582 start_codon:yes stop_codon:yes gene_type:complete